MMMTYLPEAKQFVFDSALGLQTHGWFCALTSCLEVFCVKREKLVTEYYYEGTLIACSYLHEEHFADGDYAAWHVVQITKSFISENRARLRIELLDTKNTPEFTRYEDYAEFVNDLLK